jgi:hypothetical protein
MGYDIILFDFIGGLHRHGHEEMNSRLTNVVKSLSHDLRILAPCFNWSVTMDQKALAKYSAIGFQNVIKSQCGCNQFMYHSMLPQLATVLPS